MKVCVYCKHRVNESCSGVRTGSGYCWTKDSAGKDERCFMALGVEKEKRGQPCLQLSR